MTRDVDGTEIDARETAFHRREERFRDSRVVLVLDEDFLENRLLIDEAGLAAGDVQSVEHLPQILDPGG